MIDITTLPKGSVVKLTPISTTILYPPRPFRDVIWSDGIVLPAIDEEEEITDA